MDDSFNRRGPIVHRIPAGTDDGQSWVPFPDGVAYLRRRHDGLIADCARWSVDRGTPVDPNVTALLCGAAEEGFNGDR